MRAGPKRKRIKTENCHKKAQSARNDGDVLDRAGQTTVAVGLGWNMIGCLTDALPVASISSIPGGIVTSSFFGYGVSYYSEDTLKPGRGYWVKVNSAGKLVLSTLNQVPASLRIRIVPTDELPPSPPGDRVTGTSPAAPPQFSLQQNYPNPFNPTTRIQYSVPGYPDGQAGVQHVSLKIYNTLGQVVATLVDGMQSSGDKAVEWDASAMTSGVYFYKLSAGSFTDVKKLTLVR